MDHHDIELLMSGIAPVIHDMVASAFKPVLARIAVLESRELPIGIPGKDGVPGPPGRDGAPGLSGKDFNLEECIPKIEEAARLCVVNALPKSSMIDNEGQLVFIFGDGEHKCIGNVQGRAGRDATEIQIVRSVDETRSYGAGICAYWRGGVIRSERETSPIINGDVISAGWSVMNKGIAEEFEETIDDGRSIIRTTVYTDGSEFTRTIKTATVLDRGVWRAGVYEKGDGVTYAGSFFIAQRETTDSEKPGQSDGWRLAVKRGRDGQDGKLKDSAPKSVKA